MSGTIDVNAQYTTNTGNQSVNPATQTIASPLGAVTAVNLVSGANTITVPTGATCMFISPPASNTVVLTLKGVAGDTGIGIAPATVNGPFYFAASPPANFVINAASNTTGLTYITFL